MNYGTIYQFLNIARNCKSFAEFKLEIVFHGNAKLGTKEVYDNDIEPLIYDANAIDGTFDNIDHRKVTDYLRTQLYGISWLNDYLKSFQTIVS